MFHPGAAHQASEPTTDECNGDVVGERLALSTRRIRIVEEVGEAAGWFDVLRVAIGPQALIAFSPILGSQRSAIDYVSHLASIASTGHFDFRRSLRSSAIRRVGHCAGWADSCARTGANTHFAEHAMSTRPHPASTNGARIPNTLAITPPNAAAMGTMPHEMVRKAAFIQLVTAIWWRMAPATP